MGKHGLQVILDSDQLTTLALTLSQKARILLCLLSPS